MNSSTPTYEIKKTVASFTDWFANRLMYQHRTAELVLYLLFISGILLWEFLPISWPIFRWSLLLHSLIGIILFPLTTGLFWLSHRRLFKSSNKPFLCVSGRVIDILLVISFLSGLVLFFYGATGDTASERISDLHWLAGLIIGPLVITHAWKYSLLRFRRHND
jgi:hypothetical protein